MELDVALAIRVAEEYLERIAQVAQDLVIFRRLGKELGMGQLAKNEKTVIPPADPHAAREEMFLGLLKPSLLHFQCRGVSESGADGIAISDIKAGEFWTEDFQCISTATVPIPDRR